MHFIQKHILDQLREQESAHYSDMQPEEVESGHFRYHLKELVRDGYVESPTRGVYRLTANGQHYVDRLSRHSVNAVNMPKVITYTLLTQGDDYLLQIKDKQPYQGLMNMIGGKVHEGETTASAAVREVFEKTTLTISPPTLASVFEVIIKNDGDILTHAIAYIYTTKIAPGSAHDLQAIKKTNISHTQGLAPDTAAIILALKNNELPFGTLEITI